LPRRSSGLRSESRLSPSSRRTFASFSRVSRLPSASYGFNCTTNAQDLRFRADFSRSNAKHRPERKRSQIAQISQRKAAERTCQGQEKRRSAPVPCLRASTRVPFFSPSVESVESVIMALGSLLLSVSLFASFSRFSRLLSASSGLNPDPIPFFICGICEQGPRLGCSFLRPFFRVFASFRGKPSQIPTPEGLFCGQNLRKTESKQAQSESKLRDQRVRFAPFCASLVPNGSPHPTGLWPAVRMSKGKAMRDNEIEGFLLENGRRSWASFRGRAAPRFHR